MKLASHPGIAVYIGAMPPRWPHGRKFLQAHAALSTFPDPQHAIVVFHKREAARVIRQKLCEIAS